MNRHSQQGLTTIGWIVVIAIFGSIVLTGFKVMPMYMEYFQVKSVMDSVATDSSIDAKSKKDLYEALNKRLYINSVRYLEQKNFTFSRKDNITTITVDYEVRKPYIAQLFIGGHFTYSVETDR